MKGNQRKMRSEKIGEVKIGGLKEQSKLDQEKREKHSVECTYVYILFPRMYLSLCILRTSHKCGPRV